jgi:hypothetical protein
VLEARCHDRGGKCRSFDPKESALADTATAPAGWYDDGSGRQRWWDGQRWTEHFAAEARAQQEPAAVSTEPKASIFGRRRERAEGNPISALSKADARALAQRLQDTVDRHGLTDVVELERVKDNLRKETDALRQDVTALEHAVEALRADVVDLRDSATLQELGLFDYEHPTESSATLASELETLRYRVKEMVRTGGATSATRNFTFNNSAAKGRKFVNDMSKILLRAFNAEAENCVKTMRAGNLTAAQQRLTKVAEQIARQGAMIDLRITPPYLELRLRELALASQHLQTLQAEKELERERRAELREQQKAEAELRREREKLEKEKAQYLLTLEALRASGDLDGVDRMQARLVDVQKALDDVEYRAANVRAGHVYVISNVGSFGPDMVKIGMTRRLDPMDRVRELGDASVPFRFDVHALFFADDAVGVETMLHQTFAEQRVNKVNTRREYFRVTPQEVLQALQEHSVELVEFTVDPAAEEFRLSGGVMQPESVTV